MKKKDFFIDFSAVQIPRYQLRGKYWKMSDICANFMLVERMGMIVKVVQFFTVFRQEVR